MSSSPTETIATEPGTDEPSGTARPIPPGAGGAKTGTEDTADQAGPMDSIRVLLPFAKDGRRYYILSALLAVAGALAELGVYYVVYLAVVRIVTKPELTADGLHQLAAIGAILVATRVLLDGASTWISHRAAFGTLERLRLRIGEKLSKVPLGFINRQRSGEIQRVMIDDVERLELFLALSLIHI